MEEKHQFISLGYLRLGSHPNRYRLQSLVHRWTATRAVATARLGFWRRGEFT